MSRLIRKNEIAEAFGKQAWQRIVYSEFEATLLSKIRKFPCVFGVSGFKADHLRFVFLDQMSSKSLAPFLSAYIDQARNFGSMTSLVVFSRPGPVKSIETYRSEFWSLLRDLEHEDTKKRPSCIPTTLDDPLWEFCFAGEPIFVVCNTPSHVLRQSRRSTSLTITFQPRWVFEGITDSSEPSVLRSLQKVREHLKNYDAIETFPYLDKYGNKNNREYRQYFISDSNDEPTCPYYKIVQETNEEVKIA